MITVYTCLPSHRYSSFTQWAHLCWRHTYCQWPIIELAMNVSPKNKTCQTDRQTKYCNPRCACAPRVNYLLCSTHVMRHCHCHPRAHDVIFIAETAIKMTSCALAVTIYSSYLFPSAFEHCKSSVFPIFFFLKT